MISPFLLLHIVSLHLKPLSNQSFGSFLFIFPNRILVWPLSSKHILVSTEEERVLRSAVRLVYFPICVPPLVQVCYSDIDQPTKRQWSAPLNHQMNTSNSSTPHYGNHQHQYILPPHNQPPASFFMQPY